MFGILDLETGKVWEAKGDIEPYTDWMKNINFDDGHVAVPKDYINSWESGHKCEHEGCFNDGCVVCNVPEQGDYIDMLELKEYLCQDHAYEAGYCTLCGDFWGGIESFDFNNPSQLCENCLEQLKDEIGEDDNINGDEYD